MKRLQNVLVLLLLATRMMLSAAPPSPVPKMMDLKVLYVGGTGDGYALGKEPDPAEVKARMAAFEHLLKTYFTRVTVLHARDYRQEKSSDFDVTVMDGLPAPREKGEMIRDASGRVTKVIADRYFTEDFDRPVVLVAELNAKLGQRIGMKFDWYCLCLTGSALGLRTEHPIFHGPFPVRLTLQERPTPRTAFEYEAFTGKPTPQTVAMWQVQTQDYTNRTPDSSFVHRPGMVARPWGFEDSPDAEIISGGASVKSLDAAALARHGNFFNWGFAGSPAIMTEEAKRVFANAVAYISKFKEQGLMARKYDDRRPTRIDAFRLARFLATRKAYDQVHASMEESARTMEEARQKIVEKQAKGGKLSEDEKMFLDQKSEPPQPRESFEAFLKAHQGERFTRFGTDEAAYAKYFDENEDYFYVTADSHELAVDQDAKGLGIPITDPRLLDRAIRLWEEGKDVAKARRILTRYTLLDYPTPVEWRSWFNTYREKLYFTQSGGFLFRVDSRDPRVPGNDYHRSSIAQELPVQPQGPRTDANNPVAATARLVKSAEGKALVIQVNIHPGFQIYAHVGNDAPYLPTQVTFELPKGYAASGVLKRPVSHPYAGSQTTGLYTGEAVFTQPLTGSGPGTAKVTLEYQACDSRVCLMPARLELTVPLS